MRKKKSLEKCKTYNTYQTKWFKEDKEEFLSKKFSIITDLSKFQCADFELKESNKIVISKEIEKIMNQNKINNNADINSEINKDNNKDISINDLKSENDNNNNIILKNKIISLDDDYFMLRSLGLEVKISILMSGESNFFIFSRCEQSELTETTLVCSISKELESARKFISFSVLEKKEDNFEIKTLKKQEIPHQDNYIKLLDLSEISFVFIDNGDNKCFVFPNQKTQNSNMLLLGDFYEPVDGRCNIMFACSGDLISIKEIEIKQCERDTYVNYRNMNNENIQCCSIF